MEGVTNVYHCAAIVTFSKKNTDELYAVNIVGTTNVVNASIDAGVKKLLHVSSVSALGRLKDAQYITEEIMGTEESNRNVYSKSKFLAEMEVWRGIGEGLQAVIVNPSVILGVADWNNSSTKIFKTAFEEFPWYTDGVTGFVDVRDVVRAYYLLFKKGRRGEVYNVCSGNGVVLKDIILKMTELLGIKVETVTDPQLIRPNENKKVIGSFQKIKDELGWQPEIKMEKSLSDIIQYWQTKVE